MLHEQIQFETEEDYRTGKTHVEYLKYWQNILATVTMGRLSAKLFVRGDCLFSFKGKLMRNQFSGEDLNQEVIKAIREKSSDIDYRLNNGFSVDIYCDEERVDTFRLNHFELPTPLEMKDILLHTLKKTMIDNPLTLIDEKALLREIHKSRMIVVQIAQAELFDLAEEELDEWLANEDGLFNILSFYQTESIGDDYGFHWITVEFETEHHNYSMIHKEIKKALTSYSF